MWSRAAVVAGIAVVAVTGCSTSITGQAAGTAQGGGAQVASVADLGSVVQHSADARNAVHFEGLVDVPDQGALTATGDMTFGGAHASGRMTMNLPGLGEFRIVVVDTAVYMAPPADLLGQLGLSPATPWLSVPLAGTSNAELGSTVNLAAEMDPTHMIDEIAAAGTITQTSQEEINGVPTTHYAIKVDVATLARTMTDNPTEQQTLTRVTVPTIPFDLWVDSANLPVRLVTTEFLAGTATAAPQQVSMTTNYSRWGEQVSITPPPAGQVHPLGGN